MAVSRKMRREMEKQSGAKKRSIAQKRKAQASAKKRTNPIQFLREVKGELMRVSWPSRSELTSSTTLVLVTATIITGIVYVMDLVFSRVGTFLTQ